MSVLSMKKKRVLNTLHSALCLMVLLFAADLAFSASTANNSGNLDVYFDEDLASSSDTEIVFDVSYPLMLDKDEEEWRETEPGGPETEQYELPEYKPFVPARDMGFKCLSTQTLWAKDKTQGTGWDTFMEVNTGKTGSTGSVYGKANDPVVYGGHVAISKTNHNGWRWAKLSNQAKNQAGQPINIPENQVFFPKANDPDGKLYFPLKIDVTYNYCNFDRFRPPVPPTYQDQLGAIYESEKNILGHEYLHYSDATSTTISEPIWEVLRSARPRGIYFQVPNNANPNDVLRELVGDPAKARIEELTAYPGTRESVIRRMALRWDAGLITSDFPPNLQYVIYQRWTVTSDFRGPGGTRRVVDWTASIPKNGSLTYEMGLPKTVQDYINEGFVWRLSP